MKKIMGRFQKAHRIALNECRWELKENKNFKWIMPLAYVVCFLFKLL